ncbi:response regulator [Sphingomonas sp. MMS24-JH45]
MEDEPLVRMMVCELLDDAGYRVEEAESGDHAEALMTAGLHPDLLLTDIRMPGSIDGFDLICRTVARLPSIKTIAMSGYTGVGGSAQVADRFLSKPFRPPNPPAARGRGPSVVVRSGQLRSLTGVRRQATLDPVDVATQVVGGAGRPQRARGVLRLGQFVAQPFGRHHGSSPAPPGVNLSRTPATVNFW